MNKIMTAVAAVLLVSATAMAAPSAYARAGGNGHMGTIGAAGGAHFEADDHFENYRLGEANGGQWHSRRFYPGVALYGGDYGPAYTSGCGWLRREAATTDSPYWWHRYRQCLNG